MKKKLKLLLSLLFLFSVIIFPVGSESTYTLEKTNPDKEPSNYRIDEGIQYLPEESLTYQ